MSAPSNPGADEEFVERIRATPADDLRDFETLVLRHQRQVRANCRYLTRSEEHAEDLAQEAFLKAYFGLAKFEGRSKFRTWLYTIKIRHCQDFLTKSRRHTFVALEDPAVAAAPELAVSPTAEDALVNAADRKEIGAVLDQFAESLRIPLLLCDLDGLTYQEIADELGLGLSAVKMPIMRARREFRRHFADSSGPAGVGAKPPPPA